MHAQSDSLNGGLLEACRVKCLLLAGVGVGGMGGGRCTQAGAVRSEVMTFSFWDGPQAQCAQRGREALSQQSLIGNGEVTPNIVLETAH